MREHALAKVKCGFVPVPPESGYPRMAAVRISGNALLPFLPAGSVLYYNECRTGGFGALLDTLCAVQLKDGFIGAGIVKNGSLYWTL